MMSLLSNYYYIVLILQAVCAIHCVRKGTQNKWIWLIIFLPLIGSIVYIFSEMFTGNEMQQVQSGVSTIFNPSGKIRALQEQVKFRDTFDNRIALADAYLEANQPDLAIEIYEQSLTGTFAEHEHGCIQLQKAFYEKGRYQEVINLSKKIYNLPQFKRARPNMLYAIALGSVGENEAAEKEFLTMMGKFSNYENRYYFGKFLKHNGRIEEARKIYTDIVAEQSHLSSPEKRANRKWIDNVKAELKILQAKSA